MIRPLIRRHHPKPDILHQPPLDPRSYAPDLPATAAHAILKALAKDPAQRYASTGAFAAALATT